MTAREGTNTNFEQRAEVMEKHRRTGFQKGHLTNDLFAHILSGVDSSFKLMNWSPIEADFSNGFMTAALAHENNVERLIGHLAFKLTYTAPDNTIYNKVVVFKSKARGHEVASWFSSLIPNLTPEVQAAWDQIIDFTGLAKCDHTELDIAKIKDPIFSSVVPDIYWVWKDEENDIFVFAMEYLDRKDWVHTQILSGCTDDEVDDLLHGLAVLHGTYFGSTEQLDFLGENSSNFPLTHQVPNWKIILQEVRIHCSELITEEIYQLGMAIVNNMDKICKFIDTSPKCLIHNDLWPHNFCHRRNRVPDGNKKVCFYDWEMAGFGPPQMDAAFVINLIHSDTDCNTYIMKYRDYLRREVQRNNPLLLHHLETEKFLRVYDISAMFVLLRLITFYFMAWRVFKNTDVKKPLLDNLIKHIRSIKHKYSFVKSTLS